MAEKMFWIVISEKDLRGGGNGISLRIPSNEQARDRAKEFAVDEDGKQYIFAAISTIEGVSSFIEHDLMPPDEPEDEDFDDIDDGAPL